MTKQCLKTTAATVSLIVGSLISACANSGGQYERQHLSQGTVPEGVKQLSAETAKALRFNENEVAVVFVVDKDGNIQTYAKEATTRKFPLPAGDIEQMTTITMFKTSNPKVCWMSYGTLSCVSWP